MSVPSLAFTVIPLLACFLPLLASVGSYLLGVLEKPRNSTVPYPSDLMTAYPERGLYFIGLGLSATFTMVVVLLRCAQVHAYIRNKCRVLNILSLCVGVLMVVGQLIVPSFTLEENEVLHYIGAILYLASGVLYMIFQAHITRKHPFNHSSCIIFIRVLLAVLSFILPIVYILARFLAPKDRHRYYVPQSAEWALSVFCFLYIGTFSYDFSKITMALDSREVKGRNEAGEDVFLTQEFTTM